MTEYPIPPFAPPVDVPTVSPDDVSGTYNPSRDRALETLDDVALVLTESRKQVIDDLNQSFAEPESELRNQQSILIGELDNDLDSIEREYAKRYTKVGDSVSSALSESYYAAMSAGLPIPTQDEIIAAYETGNFLPVQTPDEPHPAPRTPPPAPQQKQLPLPTSQGFGQRVMWPSGVIDCGPYWPVADPIPQPIPGVGDYYDFIKWVISLGSPWSPFAFLREPTFQRVGFDGVNTWVHPNRHWIAITNQPWMVDECKGTPSNPPPPTPEPPPFDPGPTPDPTPPPPLDATCPVVDQCWEDESQKVFQKPYFFLNEGQKKEVRDYCEYLKTCKRLGLPIRPSDPKGSVKPSIDFKVKPPGWCDPDIYEQLFDFQVAVTDPAKFLRGIFGIESDPSGGYKYPQWLEWMRPMKLIPEWVPQAITGILDVIIDMTHEAAKFSNELLGERATTGIAADTIYNVYKLMNEWIGFPPGSWVRSWEKAVNFFGPEEPPGTSEAIEGWLNGVYHNQQRDAYIGAANNCTEPYEKLAYGRRTRPNVSDVTTLFLQNKMSEEEWEKAMRENGVVDETDMMRFRQLVDQYPPVSDLIRFLVRDVADPKIVKKYSLDANFDDKWQGELVKYAVAQGLQEQEARYYWRAHWDFPSPTQLYNMLHRLRPGKVPDEVVVTETDVLEALGVNDINPYWQKRLVAISYNPLTRTDTQRAFFIGAMSEEEVLDSYQDGGYTRENAEILLRFTKKLRDNQRRSAAGLPGPKQIISSYVDGLAGVRETADQLRDFGWDEDLINRSLTNADLKREKLVRKSRIQRVKREYVRGTLSTQEASSQLALLNLDNHTIRYNLDLWDAEMAGKSKLPQAAQLCKWFEKGLLSPDEYQRKLYAIGYRGDDLARILNQCGIEVSEKITKKQQQEADKQKREAEKQRKERERKEKEAKKEAEKQRKEEEKRRKEEEKQKKEDQ